MEKLLECPFCGGEAEYYSDCDMVKVRCSACGANTSGWWDEPEEAATDWNRRPAPENKALTLENGFDITNADGTPVDYDAIGQKYKGQLCYCDIDGFYIGEDGQLVLMDDCGASVPVDRGDYHIEARKPEED